MGLAVVLMGTPICRTCKAREWAVSSEESNLRRMAARAAMDPSPSRVRMVTAAQEKLDKARRWRDAHEADCLLVAA